LFGDKWDPKFPTKVGLSAWRDRTGLKPVGFLGPNAAGPFGHQDMLGQVWEWVLGIGYGPQVDEKVHEREYDKLRRQVENDKGLSAKGRTLPEAVAFNDDRAMAKGSGSFYSFSQERWDELRLNVRAPLSLDQTMEGLGFRPAKSYRAALDMTLSRLRAEYMGNQYFLIDQRLALAEQDGIERYDLEKGGTLITNYHAISIIPINFLTREKSLRPRPLEAHTRKTPVILGALITTEATKSPALKKGIYTVYYRHAGLPKELVSALKEGGTVLKKEELERIRAEKIAKRKRKKKDSKKKDPKKDPKKEGPKKDQKKKKGPDWRKVIARYGFVTADFKDEEGKINRSFWKDVDYVYLKQPDDSRMKMPAKQHSLLIFRANDGNWASFKTIDKKFGLKFLRGGNRVPKRLVLTTRKLSKKEEQAGVKANQVVEFHFAVPPTKKESEQRSNTRSVFKLALELLDPPATGNKSWRTNYAPVGVAAEADSGSGNGKAKNGGKSNGKAKRNGKAKSSGK
ncbi:MAG: hypothetical protein ACYST0_06885, partial [Planctomycetota bacterium]